MAYHVMQGPAEAIPYADGHFDLVFGSPPYGDCRTYGMKGVARKCQDWVEWMLDVTEESLRVCRGPVIWVASSYTRKRNYQPACEGLMWEWYKRGGHCHAMTPNYWHRCGIPGSGGDQSFRSDIEIVMIFKRPGRLPFAVNTADGQPPKHKPGGEVSHRTKSGERTTSGSYSPPEIASPGNLIQGVHVGKGHMGSDFAHQNEAPFPEKLASRFIRAFCPEVGIVLDPFCGSGTTVAVAHKLGRHAVGIDIRQSQVEIALNRMESIKLEYANQFPIMEAPFNGDAQAQ